MTRSSDSTTATHTRLRRIEGRHNSLVKELRQAFARAERTKDGDCAIEGVRIIEETIRSGLRFRAVFFRESAQKLAERLMPQIGAHVETLLLPDRLFDGTVASESPQGVAALVRLKEFSLEDLIERVQVGPVVIVIGLQDPGNLGTILRSAEAFGSAGVVLGVGTVSPYNSKVIRASAGSIFRLPLVNAVEVNSLLQKLRAQNIRILATSSHKGTPLPQAQLVPNCAILIGAEGSGLARNVLSQVDETIAIPHASHVESLNAGVAASIVLYEAARQ
ncbi:MAG TPA: RNA methyltransferase, partial [Verrucomicrobiae bacterium]|nr:RNA methyltransferase [Verrucomicrobiae bacterium]